MLSHLTDHMADIFDLKVEHVKLWSTSGNSGHTSCHAQINHGEPDEGHVHGGTTEWRIVISTRGYHACEMGRHQ